MLTIAEPLWHVLFWRVFGSLLTADMSRRRRSAKVGRQYTLPSSGGSGLGKTVRSTIHPFRAEIPVFLGAEGPKDVALAAEVADGWLPSWFSPKSDRF